MEIYNESIRDLLCPENDNLKIHESLTRGVFVGNLTEEPIQSAAEALLLVRRGEEWRRMGETNLNEKSSRSHTIVRLVLEVALPSSSWNVPRPLRVERRVAVAAAAATARALESPAPFPFYLPR